MSSDNKGTNFETLCVLVSTANMGSEFSRAYLRCFRVNSSLINDGCIIGTNGACTEKGGIVCVCV